MNKIEPIERGRSITQLINDTKIGGDIAIHAKSLQSFKTTLSRVNAERDINIEFSYSDFVDNFCTATRTK